MNFLVAFVATFILSAILVPLLLAIARVFGVYDIVQERRCHVYVLFGNVVGTLSEPGIHFLMGRLGIRAFLVRWLGKRYILDNLSNSAASDEVFRTYKPIVSFVGNKRYIHGFRGGETAVALGKGGYGAISLGN